MLVGKKSSKRDLTQSKLSSILGFIASQPTYKVIKNVNANVSKSGKFQHSYISDTAKINRRKNSAIEVDVEDYQKFPLETKKLRKNQSMSDMPQTLSGNSTQITPSSQFSHPFLKYASVHQALSQQKHKCINLSSQSFQRPIPPINKLNNKSSNMDQIEKIRCKLRLLLQERENLTLIADQSTKEKKEINFFTQFNQTLHNLCSHVMSESRGTPKTNMQKKIKQFRHNSAQSSLSSTLQDSISTLNLDNIFKSQISILQQYPNSQKEKNQHEQTVIQLRKKNDNLILDNAKFIRELQSASQETKKAKTDFTKATLENAKLIVEVKRLENQLDVQVKQINLKNIQQKSDNELGKNLYQQQDENVQDIDKQELKYLIQGQFEAIQKLLQREQLVKVFLRRVGDTNILQMFEQFITNSEQIDCDETEGNINVNILEEPSNRQIQQPKPVVQKVQVVNKTEHQLMADKLIHKYEESYKQLNLCDSLMADDSSTQCVNNLGINDSEESSFEYYGKQHTSEVSCQLQPGQGFLQQKKQTFKPVKQTRDFKEKLKINMMDLQLIQANQRRELQKQMEMQQQQEDNYAQQSEDIDPLNQMLDFSFPSQSVKESQF